MSDDTRARAAAGSSHDHGNCELCDELERTRADAVAQVVKDEQYLRRIKEACLESAEKEVDQQAEDIARLHEAAQNMIDSEAMLQQAVKDRDEEIARLRADIADNERRIGHREEKIAMIQDLKCPTCAEFQDHFENQKQNIKTLVRTVRQLKQITPRRDERFGELNHALDIIQAKLDAAEQEREAMQRRAEAAEGDWQAAEGEIARLKAMLKPPKWDELPPLEDMERAEDLRREETSND